MWREAYIRTCTIPCANPLPIYCILSTWLDLRYAYVHNSACCDSCPNWCNAQHTTYTCSPLQGKAHDSCLYGIETPTAHGLSCTVQCTVGTRNCKLVHSATSYHCCSPDKPRCIPAMKSPALMFRRISPNTTELRPYRFRTLDPSCG